MPKGDKPLKRKGGVPLIRMKMTAKDWPLIGGMAGTRLKKKVIQTNERAKYDRKPNRLITDDVRWLIAEVRALRQRHAAAVEAAWREGYESEGCCCTADECKCIDRDWDRSDAKRGLT